jgi:hypothetical protein
MISVVEAQAKVVEGLKPLGSEQVSLGGALAGCSVPMSP